MSVAAARTPTEAPVQRVSRLGRRRGARLGRGRRIALRRTQSSVNTKIRLITRVAFGFSSPDALIALAMLNLGGHKPILPGRK